VSFFYLIVFTATAISINLNLAKQRSRQQELWVILALLFGLFSTLVLWFLPTQEPQKKCRYCLSAIPEAALKCRYCQSDVSFDIS